MASNALLFVIVGKNEPLYEYNKVQAADSVTRQNYFVLHSALDLVEKAAYTTNNMYLRVVDKVRRRKRWLGARRWAVHAGVRNNSYIPRPRGQHHNKMRCA